MSHDTGAETNQLHPAAVSEAKEEVGDDDYRYDGEREVDIDDLPPVELAKKKRKKRTKRPKSQRGLDKPSGFEEFFADVPMTPAEAKESKQIYDPGLPFADRISTAIARFERTRKLTPERRNVLYKYLVYGSVDVGPNMFQTALASAGESNTEEASDTTRVAELMSQASLGTDQRNIDQPDSRYTVDFYACAAGFLARHARQLFGCETELETQTSSSTIERFMDYLLQHDVANEYADDILRARNLCRIAHHELWAVSRAIQRVPGDFNVACSTLWGGVYAQSYDGTTSWAPETASQPKFVGFTHQTAEQIVHFGVATAASEAVFQRYLASTQGVVRIEVVESKETGFEITTIQMPSARNVEIYTAQCTEFQPVGIVTAKPWKNPDDAPDDLTPAEREALASSLTQSKQTRDQDTYTFFIESELLSYLRTGTRVEAKIHITNVGLMFFSEVKDILPSFDTYLLNEMILGYKAPRPVKGAFDYIDPEESNDQAAVDEQSKDGDGVIEFDAQGDRVLLDEAHDSDDPY